MSSKEMKCINCMHPAPELYHEYSKEVIRLADCKKCGKIVDKYVEYDNVLLVIDMMLHTMEAYRHLIYNMKIQNFFRLGIIFLFCDTYDKWIIERSRAGQDANVTEMEYIFYRSFLLSVVEMSVYIGLIVLLAAARKKSKRHLGFVASSTLLGYYGNVAVVLSIIFRLSNVSSYRLVLQLFLFASHVQVQRALFPATPFYCNTMVVLLSLLCSYLARVQLAPI